MKFAQVAASAAVVYAVSACGGSGASSGNAPGPTSVPGATASPISMSVVPNRVAGSVIRNNLACAPFTTGNDFNDNPGPSSFFATGAGSRLSTLSTGE